MNTEQFYFTLQHFDKKKWLDNGWEEYEYGHWKEDPDAMIHPIPLPRRHKFIKYLDSQWAVKGSRKIEYDTYCELKKYELGEREERREIYAELRAFRKENKKLQQQIARLVNNKHRIEKKLAQFKSQCNNEQS